MIKMTRRDFLEVRVAGRGAFELTGVSWITGINGRHAISASPQSHTRRFDGKYLVAGGRSE